MNEIRVWSIGGMILTGGKRKYSEKNESSCRFGQQKSHMDFFRDWTWATVIRDRRLTTWTMARLRKYGLRNGLVGYLPPFHQRQHRVLSHARPYGLGICGRQSGAETNGSPNTSLLAGSTIPPMPYIYRSITDAMWVIDSNVEYTEKRGYECQGCLHSLHQPRCIVLDGTFVIKVWNISLSV